MGPNCCWRIVLGNEIEARIGLAVSPKHYSLGWHITSTCGVFGAAAAERQADRSRCPAKLVWALGAAATQSVRSVRMPRHRGEKRQRRQCGAQRSAGRRLLAEKGFDGPPEPLNGVQGFYNAMGVPPDLVVPHRRSRRDLGDHGDRLQALSVRLRHQPGARLCAGLAAGQSKRRSRARWWCAAIRYWPTAPTGRSVSTGRQSQVSVQHAVAAALITAAGRTGAVQR